MGDDAAAHTEAHTKSMDEIMALCKRRGFVYPASEIYGGINGFWDYGPLGSLLKKNLRDAWFQDVVMTGCCGQMGPNGEPIKIVPVDTCIIQNPRVWEASGHVAGFNDPMIDCRESKSRYRADHLMVLRTKEAPGRGYGFLENDDAGLALAMKKLSKYSKQDLGESDVTITPVTSMTAGERDEVVGPDAKEAATLTEPRAFNLMFKTYVGALATEDDVAYLRPETAQGIFIHFKNVVDTMRVKLPFGIAQIGKSFRNEVTPRNFTFRSREFEQMEVEFFCHPDEAEAWYTFWRDWRMNWWESLGLRGDNLILREHDADELAHYAKDGAGTSDVEYRFPFTAPGYGELEGVAHRTDFDLRQHQEHAKVKLEYFDTTRGELAKNGQPKGERYIPHCIEPSGGLDRGVLALLCEAYTPDPDRGSGVYMKFHPRIAPIKAGVFPLVNKDGMPETARALHTDLTKRFAAQGLIEFDAKQSVGKRYARMDEAGCPYCFTIDSDTQTDQTVTVRDRDSGAQDRIGIDRVPEFLADRVNGS